MERVPYIDLFSSSRKNPSSSSFTRPSSANYLNRTAYNHSACDCFDAYSTIKSTHTAEGTHNYYGEAVKMLNQQLHPREGNINSMRKQYNHIQL